LKVAAGYVDRISKGEVPAKITDPYNGDFNVIKDNLNNCIDGLAGLVEANAVLQRMSVNDYTRKVEGSYQGVFKEVAGAVNQVQSRLFHVQEIVTAVGRGDLSELDALRKVNGGKGRRCDNDQLVPGLIAMMSSIQTLLDEMEHMAKEHDVGEIDAFVADDKFEGAYRVVAKGVNEMVKGHIAVKKKAMACVSEFGKGNFDAPLERFPGKKAFINDTIEALRTNLKQVADAIKGLVDAAEQGRLDHRSNAKAFQGDWAELVKGLNATLDAIMAPINEAAATLDKLADRDLRARVHGNFLGDHAKIKNAVNSTAEALHEALSQVAMAANQISSASGQIAAGSQSVAKGASGQASALEQTSSSMEEMSGMTQQNADNTQQAKALAEATRLAADKGARAMAQMLDSMGRIRASAEGTAVIIGDINEIAFQTNLLALNAAVEAARAGDAGRGFAVVAEEVRNLAQRAKEAAKKTEELIKGSVKLAEGGQVISNEVNGNLGEINDSVGKVANIVGEIAAASREQSKGILQVNKALTEMDKITQQNAANSEESSSAAEELAGQAQELASMVAQFQLSHSQSMGAGARSPSKAMTYAQKSPEPSARGGRPGNGGSRAMRLRAEDVIPLESDPDFAKF
jgi:methyl-accepting chemotaxis protein